MAQIVRSSVSIRNKRDAEMLVLIYTARIDRPPSLSALPSQRGGWEDLGAHR